MNRALLAALLCGAIVRPSRAQQPVAAAPTTLVADTVPTFERPNGALLRTGILTYDLTLQRAGLATPLGTRVVTVSDESLAGMPAWLVVEQRAGTVVETSDSVHATRGDLSPLRWVATSGRAQLAASFAGDSAFGAVQGYQGRSSFALAVPRNALLSAGMTERVIEMLPLRDGYRAAASLVLIDESGPRVAAAEISVARAEHVSVAGADVECWVVLLRAGAVEERLWVSREGSRVVRTEQATSTGLLVGVLR